MSPRRRQNRREGITPLSELPEDFQSRIQAQVDAPEPPSKWISVGGSPRPIAWLPSRGWWEWHWQRGIFSDEKRSSLPPKRRRAVIARDGYVCGICVLPVEPTDVHIDHIFPVALGGGDDLSNLRVTHSRCNIAKGAKV
jgi:HNH endonuclease